MYQTCTYKNKKDMEENFGEDYFLFFLHIITSLCSFNPLSHCLMINRSSFDVHLFIYKLLKFN